MLRASFFILLFAISLLANAASLFFMQEAAASIKLPVPNVKGQFQKGNLQHPVPMTIQADQVSFNSGENKATAQGNVVVISADQQLYCDQLQIDRIVQEAVAEGHVYLDTPQEQVQAQGMTYNFNRYTGEFRDARIFTDPYQIKGRVIDKVSENHMIMKEGYLTTSDWDQPDYRVTARRMDVFTKDRAIMRGMKIYLGKVPVMYLPYYVQDLKNRPIWTVVPGKSKNFGFFLLTTLRLKPARNVGLTIHSDVRERTGFGEGFDVKYDTPNFGKGIFTAYYTAENKIAAHHIWRKYNSQGIKRGPTTHHERYRLRWRHKWQIDQNTQAIWQIYKIHDWDIVNNGFLKEYFKREYYQNADITNYFLLTRVMPHGTLTFNIIDSSINRPLRGVDRLPEITYTLNNTQIGKTGFYAKSVNTYSNLFSQNYPKTFARKAMRFDTNNDISHPLKIAFLQFNPHVGGDETYYSRNTTLSQRDIFRGQFHAGADVITKFYRIWNYNTNFWGLNIHGLRHIITPSVSYVFQHSPTVSSTTLNQFDAIDSLDRAHYFKLILENQLQTKRNGQAVDLIRAVVSSNFALKENPGIGGFGPVDSLIDMYPTSWLTLHADTEYNHYNGYFNTINFDGTVHGKNWALSFGDRYASSQGSELTIGWNYRINPKWKVSLYERVGVGGGKGGVKDSGTKEEEYVVTRDLHDWEMDFSYHLQRGVGEEFFLVFRLKAFPDTKLDLFNTAFHERKPGSQSTDITGASPGASPGATPGTTQGATQ